MNFSQWCRESPLNVHEVAEQLGVHRQTVDRYVRGELMPRPAIIAAIGSLTAGKVGVADLLAAYNSRRAQ